MIRKLLYGSFRKLGVPCLGVPITRILLLRALYWGPLFSETPFFRVWGRSRSKDPEAFKAGDRQNNNLKRGLKLWDLG